MSKSTPHHKVACPARDIVAAPPSDSEGASFAVPLLPSVEPTEDTDGDGSCGGEPNDSGDGEPDAMGSWTC